MIEKWIILTKPDNVRCAKNETDQLEAVILKKFYGYNKQLPHCRLSCVTRQRCPVGSRNTWTLTPEYEEV
ncbi:hypothetical protein C824_002548 [Schaedlerella arabinosiphila]|nr:hypothetical protein C824_002548 [Schaedlerella arabinosiphila]